jgi:hypothetical protein
MASAANTPSSSLPEIYETHRNILQRLDDLEHRLASRVAAHRRRAINILEETSDRRTHMRVFVSHRLDDESNHPVEHKAAVAPPPKPLGGKDFGALLSVAAAHHVLPQKKSHRKWTLVIEGGLLIKQLDYDSAKEVDRRWDAGLPLLGNVSTTDPNDSLRANKYEISSRNQFTSEVQEFNKSAKPLMFTHLFDKLEVEMKAVKESLSSEDPAPSTEETAVGHQVKSFTRKKANTPDSHAFLIVYNEEGRIPLTNPNQNDQNESPKAEYDSDYISAQIRLYRRQGKEDMYVPSDQMSEVFFPSFIGKKPLPQNSKKRKAQDSSIEPLSDVPKDVIIPNTLTMDEALHAIFFYIRTRNLNDPTDCSIINFDETLAELFGSNRMLLAELRKTLIERGLLVKVEAETHPIILNYKMTVDGAEPLVEEKLSDQDTQVKDISSPQPSATRRRSSNDGGKGKDESAEKQPPKDPHLQTMLSCDIDIEIPNIYHLRTRDILRRINHREHEYTSCRNKAKNSLVATGISEDTAKQAVDDTIIGSNLTPDLKQVWMALANGSHEGGEAQRAALIELRTASLMEKLEERTAIARGHWDIVEACRSLVGDGST